MRSRHNTRWDESRWYFTHFPSEESKFALCYCMLTENFPFCIACGPFKSPLMWLSRQYYKKAKGVAIWHNSYHLRFQMTSEAMALLSPFFFCLLQHVRTTHLVCARNCARLHPPLQHTYAHTLPINPRTSTVCPGGGVGPSSGQKDALGCSALVIVIPSIPFCSAAFT